MAGNLQIKRAVAECSTGESVHQGGAQTYRKASTAVHQPGAQDSGDLLDRVCNAVGHKQFCYGLRVTTSLGYQWRRGDKLDPLDRTREIMRVAVAAGHVEIAAAMLDWLAGEIRHIVLAPEQVRAICELAESIGLRLCPYCQGRLQMIGANGNEPVYRCPKCRGAGAK